MILSYLIFVLVEEIFLVGGCAYLVWWHHASPWWFLFVVLILAGTPSPRKWRRAWTGPDHGTQDTDHESQ